MSKKTLKYIFSAFLYAAPFILVFIIDHFVLHRFYFSTPTDTVATTYGMGLSWVSLRPNPVLHHPGYFFQEISGLLIRITGLNPKNLFLFNNAGITVHFLFLAGASIWMAHLSEKLNIKKYLLLIIGLVTATMPAIALYMGLWALYFPLAVLSVPLALATYKIVLNQKNSLLAVFLPIAVLGFVVGNFLLGAFFAIAALIGLLAISNIKDAQSLNNRLGLAGYFPSFRTKIILTLLLAIFILSIGLGIANPIKDFSAPIPFRSILILGSLISLASLLIAVVIVWFVKKWKQIETIFYGLGLPLLTGWIISTNILAPFWGISARRALLLKGSSNAAQSSLVQNLAKLEIASFFVFSVWNWFLAFLFIIGLIALIKGIKTRRNENNSSLFVGLLCLISLVLNLIAVADVALIPSGAGWFHPKNFGQISRYFALLVAPLALSLVWVFKQKKRGLNIILLIACITISIISFSQYISYLSPIIKGENSANIEIQKIVNTYLQKQPDGLVVCSRTMIPESCSVLYAYNNCRNALSMKKLNKTTLFNDHIQYARHPNETCLTSVNNCLGLENTSDIKEILLITENRYSQFLPSSSSLIWQSPNTENSVWMINR